jgi:hypothetical protein
VELEQGFECALHVCVAGVNLIDHEHLAHQAQQSQRLMLALEHAKQGLVNGADAGRREEGALVVIGQPALAATGRAFVVLLQVVSFVAPGIDHGGSESLDQFLLPVSQHEAGRATEETVIHLGDTTVHGVRGGHRRQADEEPVSDTIGDQPVRQHHRGLGLARAGNVFEKVDLRSSRKCGGRGPFLQR